MSDAPIYFLLAGPNGAGKSTLYEDAFDKAMAFINPDVIAKEIAPDDVNNPLVSIRAGKIALAQMVEAMAAKRSFVFETTLTSKQSLRSLAMAKANGYLIALYYVGVNCKEISICRVAARVAAGGHDIPKNALERRYVKSLVNLPKAMALADVVAIYNNSDKVRRRVLMLEKSDELVSSKVALAMHDLTIDETSNFMDFERCFQQR